MEDLSFWCYGADDGMSGCDSYIDALLIHHLQPLFNQMHFVKHGRDANLPDISAFNTASDYNIFEIELHSDADKLEELGKGESESNEDITNDSDGDLISIISKMSIGKLFCPKKQIGLVYDDRMMLHKHEKDNHPEQPLRIKTIFDVLSRGGIVDLVS